MELVKAKIPKILEKNKSVEKTMALLVFLSQEKISNTDTTKNKTGAIYMPHPETNIRTPLIKLPKDPALPKKLNTLRIDSEAIIIAHIPFVISGCTFLPSDFLP